MTIFIVLFQIDNLLPIQLQYIRSHYLDERLEKQRKHQSTKDMRTQIYERRGKKYLNKKLALEKIWGLFPASATPRRYSFLFIDLQSLYLKDIKVHCAWGEGKRWELIFIKCLLLPCWVIIWQPYEPGIIILILWKGKLKF